MRTVRPHEYIGVCENANVAQVTIYDLRPDRKAKIQLVAGIRVDGHPLGIVFTRQRKIKVWASWETCVTHFQSVILARELDISIKTGVVPDRDVEDFQIPGAYRDAMIAVGPRDIRESDGSETASDSGHA